MPPLRMDYPGDTNLADYDFCRKSLLSHREMLQFYVMV